MYKHSIQLAGGSVGKRSSKSRKYEACIVATVTEARVQNDLESLKVITARYDAGVIELNRLMAEHGMTIEAARAECEKYSRDYRSNVAYWNLPCGKIDKLHRETEMDARSLQTWRVPTVGNEFVVSWHLTVRNAQTALGNQECQGNRSVGYSLKIRTDIEVK